MAAMALSTSVTTAPCLTISASITRQNWRQASARAGTGSCVNRVGLAVASGRPSGIPRPNFGLVSTFHDNGAVTFRTHLHRRSLRGSEVQGGRRTGLLQGARAASAAANEGMKSLAVAVGIPLVLGVIDSVFNSPGTKWYFDLKKPKWQPPSFLFGGAWSVLYPLMGLASWLVWAEGGWAKQSYPLTIYAVQLALNLAWPALFFGARNLAAALADIVVLDIAVIATIIAFKPANPVAANLLKPYLAWVLFATALNYKLWDLNKGGEAASPAPSAS